MKNNESIPVYKREKTEIESKEGESTELRRDLFNAIREAYFNKYGSVFVEPGELNAFINILKSPRVNEILNESLWVEVKMDGRNFYDVEPFINLDDLGDNYIQFSFEQLGVVAEDFGKRSERAAIIASAVFQGKTKIMRKIMASVGGFRMGNFPDRAARL